MKLTALALLLLLPALGTAQTNPAQLQQLFADYHEDFLRENPELATMLGRSEYNHRWRDWSPSAVERRHQQARRYLQRLEQFPLTNLPEQDQISARLLRYQLERELETELLDTYLLRVAQMLGFHNRVYITVDQMPGRTVRDYENIIARLNAVPAYVDQNLALLDEAIRQRLVQPRVVVDLVLQQLATQIAQDGSRTPLLAAFRRFPSSISNQDQEQLRRQAAAAYEQRFLPAWRKLDTYLGQTYARKARENTALSAIPNGKQAYALLVRFMTTTRMTPEEIHALGKQEVQRIETAMEALAREVGFQGRLADFERQLNGSPEQHFRSKEEMLVYCRNVAKIVEPELPRLFKRIPRLLYGIRPIPEDREAAEASNATPPALDESRPAWFNLNTYKPEKQVKYDKEALVLHEAVPGHIFQGAVQEQAPGLPEFRKTYRITVYGEGWALYAESLGTELGVYRDPFNRFGRLGSERFRAVRLVVDTGLHALGWARGQAVDYFQTHAPSVPLAEVDRYVSWPGQALGYKIGELKITELRWRAERELGPNFDIREFHDVVLRNGTLPLEMLEQQVLAYIRDSRKNQN
jgi:uncharacterized protein (DUF885 family)